MNRHEMVKKLMDELSVYVGEYQHTYKPADAPEWNTVLSEIETFMEAERKLSPVDVEGNILPVPNRLQSDPLPKVNPTGAPLMKLQEAILVGNYQSQIKFSELTIDMYRFLQSLERASTHSTGIKPSAPAPQSTGEESLETKEEEPKAMPRRSNPRKFLLYRPTLAQLMLYISTSFKDCAENSAMFLYLSADGSKRAIKSDSQTMGEVFKINLRV